MENLIVLVFVRDIAAAEISVLLPYWVHVTVRPHGSVGEDREHVSQCLVKQGPGAVTLRTRVCRGHHRRGENRRHLWEQPELEDAGARGRRVGQEVPRPHVEGRAKRPGQAVVRFVVGVEVHWAPAFGYSGVRQHEGPGNALSFAPCAMRLQRGVRDEADGDGRVAGTGSRIPWPLERETGRGGGGSEG